MRNLNIKIILFSLIILVFSSCGEKYDDKVFWVNLYSMHTLDDKQNGGKYVDSNSVLRVGQYNNIERIFQNYKGPIEGSIVSVWRVIRLPNGKAKYSSICGKRQREPEYIVALGEEKREKDWQEYMNNYRKRNNCVKKLQAQDELDKVQQYFYARSKPTHKVIYPPRTPNHSHWEVTVYNGRVGDLQPKALTQTQKDNLHKLRKHKCYKYGSTWKDFYCYDLEGNDTSLYYTIREQLASKITSEEGVLSSEWEGLKDIRISPPQEWVEVKGISINKEQYDYLSKVCKKGEEFCHLNNYNGKLTLDEKNYIKSVEFDSDKLYKD